MWVFTDVRPAVLAGVEVHCLAGCSARDRLLRTSWIRCRMGLSLVDVVVRAGEGDALVHASMSA